MTDEPGHTTDVRDAFAAFRDDRYCRFVTKVRRKRAQQIRKLLADPDALTLEQFNHEVWQIERATYLLPERRPVSIMTPEGVTAEDMPLLEDALERGNLELHGNYIWGSATHVYGPMIVDNAEKLTNVRDAARVLNDDVLSADQKAIQIERLKGFGWNITTGLVMVFHPDEFGLYNEPSKAAVRRLSGDVNTLAAFQDALRHLKAQTGAEDFLELDWFLYRYQQTPPTGRQYWWVNQGVNYVRERDGGFLWSGAKGARGQRISHHETMKDVRTGDVIVHYAGATIQSVSVVEEAMIIAPHPLHSPGESSDDGYLVRSAYHEFSEPIPLAEIPSEWRTREAGPFTHTGGVQQGYLYPLHERFIVNLAYRYGDRWPEAVPVAALNGATPYLEPSFDHIVAAIYAQGMRLTERIIRRYHLSLKTRGFVVLSGLSGTGKTWLAEAYAQAVGAKRIVVPVAPNWTTNEDLLGFFNPLTSHYHDTAFSEFLRAAADEHERATGVGVAPVPHHLILDEMNLARVEYYFAKFLSAMEVRMREGTATLELSPGQQVTLPPNLVVIGTVNIDETTHGFADKVYDRAQLIEVTAERSDLVAHLGNRPYAEDVMDIWDAVHRVAPFTFRVLTEINAYVDAAATLGVSWEETIDEQLLQKVLPKFKGAEPAVGEALARFVEIAGDRFPLSRDRAARMHSDFLLHGFTSYFH